ncbi:AbfB domain-containing protein [Phytohabitans rumicis]|uniref:AbfB domain-containing protein n=1 Tax=Phytohabitans rumicis TaxID=1076125 RepID=UPI001563FA11|nr:AbfB domain-containing protein [Phytohabitans rumicis]
MPDSVRNPADGAESDIAPIRLRLAMTPRPHAGRGPVTRRRMLLGGVTMLSALALMAVAASDRGMVEPATLDEPPAAALPGEVGVPASRTDPTIVTTGPAGVTTGPAVAHPGGGNRGGVPSRSTGGGAATPAAPSPSPSATTPPLRAGARVGLEPVSKPGFRVRHRDFAGRIDRIGSGSGALDRADSSFTVRAGLASSSCASFESVNFPGYYLRHQNFQIVLHRYDGTQLFRADATFCPVTGLTGQETSLRSYNYPSRYLLHRDSRLVIESGGSAASATFAVRTALA